MGLLSDFVEEAPDIVDDDDKDGFLKRTFKNAPETFATYFVAGAAQQAGKSVGKQVSDGVKGFLNLPQQARLRKSKTFIQNNQDVRNLNRTFERLINNPHELAVQKELKSGKNLGEAIFTVNKKSFEDSYVNKLIREAKEKGLSLDVSKLDGPRLDHGARQMAFHTFNGQAPSLVENIIDHRQKFLDEINDLGGMEKIKTDSNLVETLVKQHGGSLSNSYINGVKAYPKSFLNLIGKGVTPEQEAESAIKRLKESPYVKKEVREAIEALKVYGSPTFVKDKALEALEITGNLEGQKDMGTSSEKSVKFEIRGSGDNAQMYEIESEKTSNVFGVVDVEKKPKVIPLFGLTDKKAGNQFATSLQAKTSTRALNIMSKVMNDDGITEITRRINKGLKENNPFFLDKVSGLPINPSSQTLTLDQYNWFITSAYTLTGEQPTLYTKQGAKAARETRQLLAQNIINIKEIRESLGVLGQGIPAIKNRNKVTIDPTLFLNDNQDDVRQDLITGNKINMGIVKQVASNQGFEVGDVQNYAETLVGFFKDRKRIKRELPQRLEGFQEVINSLGITALQPNVQDLGVSRQLVDELTRLGIN